MSEMFVLVLFSFTTVIGLTFLIAACLLEHKLQPLFISAFYIFSPLPYFISKRLKDEQSSDVSSVSDWTYFCTTGIVVSMFALPLVWTHISVIKFWTLAAIFLANCVSLGSIYGFIRYILTDSESMEY